MGCVFGKASDEDPSRGNLNKGGVRAKQQKTASERAAAVKVVNALFGTKTTAEALAFDKSGELSGDSDVESFNLNQNAGQADASDLDLGLPRLSRLSAQYLPPTGSRVVQVPTGNFELRYSYLSQRGYYPEALDKANQDSFCVHTQFGQNPNDHFFGVFDGHGEHGTPCSQFAKKNLCENLLRNRHFQADAVQAYHTAFTQTNSQLHRHTIDDSMSGTTGVTVLVRGKMLYVANVGDSRAVLAEKRGKKLVAVDLSSDQTPFRPDECTRVKACGARVLTLDQLEGLKNPNVQCWGGEEDDDGDPPRLWVQNGMYPGTAFTRSIGDTVAERIGVMAVPEVLVMELTSKHPFFVVASDGVFEFLSSQAVVDMVAKFKDPRDACAAIVAESYRLWLQYETRTDDITIIIVHIDGLQDVEVPQGMKDGNLFSLTEKIQNTLPGFGGGKPLGTRPARHDLSRARLRAIETCLEAEEPWVPPTKFHTKTSEEKVKIDKALQSNFLFHNLTEEQLDTLYGCMERISVRAGDVIIRQGAEGDQFYIAESGEFEALVSQAGSAGEQDMGTVVSKYRGEDSACFGELALMYNKPRQASVRAVTDGSLWALSREAFRSVLLAKFTHQSALKLMRTVDVLARFSLQQLHRLADSMVEFKFQDGDVIIEKDEEVSTFYIVNQGNVQVTDHGEPKKVSKKRREPTPFGAERIRAGRRAHQSPIQMAKPSPAVREPSRDSPATSSELLDLSVQPDVEIKRGVMYFGEWVVTGLPARSITAVAVGDVEGWFISKEEFQDIIGPSPPVSEEEKRLREKMSFLKRELAAEVDVPGFEKVRLPDLVSYIAAQKCPDLFLNTSLTRDLSSSDKSVARSPYQEWQETVYSTDCCEVGVVFWKNSGKTEQVISMKRYARRKVQLLGREAQILNEKSLIQSLSPSVYVPQVLCTRGNRDFAAILLNTRLAAPLALILLTPLDESTARFVAASVVLALDFLHKDGVIYRGVSPDVLMLDRSGRLQLVDFRFAKRLEEGRTFTICGMADFLAPEVIQGQGHDQGADWWALGVLLFFMLQNELPFGSWRDSELDIYNKIAQRQLSFSSKSSAEATDLIDKLLQVEVETRLGCGRDGVEAIKKHPWFEGFDWEGLLEHRSVVPAEILSRLASALENYHADDGYQVFDLPVSDAEDESVFWLEGW